MNLRHNNEGFPSVTEEAPKDEEQEVNQSESAIEKFQPTQENPIEKFTIGLQHTLGHFECPTRIVVTLKDGRTGDMTWEEAEPHLPPEFKIVRKLGERARQIEGDAFDLETSIRGGTDVMKRSGHVKDALLQPLKKKRPALQYLSATIETSKEIDKIAQKSFLLLRQMADDGGAQENHANDIKELFSDLDSCQNKLDDLRKKAFQKFPDVQHMYEKVFQRPEKEKSLKGDTNPELSEPE